MMDLRISSTAIGHCAGEAILRAKVVVHNVLLPNHPLKLCSVYLGPYLH